MTPAPAVPAALSDALRRLLRPLVRLAIGHGVTYPALSEMLKALFVDVAARDFALPDRAGTDSRVSLLSGVHRKDVRRLREQAGAEASRRASRGVSLGAQIAAAWNSRPGYTDADGVPRPLPRTAARPGEPSFDSLVESVSKDIRPRAVLDEWLRLGVASLDTEGRVRLEASAFVPAAGLDEMAFYLGQNIHDHLAAIDHNLGAGSERFLERCVHYERIDPAVLPEIARIAETSGMKALRAVNARAAAPSTGSGDWRFNFGVYFYAEPLSGVVTTEHRDEES
jgi:hypothetical protein